VRGEGQATQGSGFLNLKPVSIRRLSFMDADGKIDSKVVDEATSANCCVEDASTQ
jgi:hypothetical protein